MDFGEQTTGTRDEQYGLIGVLYHALHGAENCNAYALDAEDDGRLAGFFREAEVEHQRLAERAKELLGIVKAPPEPEIWPEGAVSEETAAVGDVPATGTPPGTAPPGGGVVTSFSAASFDPDTEEDATAGVSQAATGPIIPEDLDSTISALEGGAVQLESSRAAAEVESWERKLEATGDPELRAIAGNLGALRALLSTNDIDVTAAGPLLTTLGEQMRQVASGDAGAPIADKLRRLSELLAGEGRSLAG